MDKKHTRKRKKSIPPPMIIQTEMPLEEVPKSKKEVVSYFDLSPWEKAIYFNFFGGC